eukprot:1137948-Pelagomonas_calceolata.AAC.1
MSHLQLSHKVRGLAGVECPGALHQQVALHTLRAGVSSPERSGTAADNFVNLVNEDNPAIARRV